MDLSVVIVSYNVQRFLQQCLSSVYAAGDGMSLEVWVVDNASVDGSVQMVRQQFPQAHLIANADNRGFAKANNQALRQATGDYLLLLNPDTLVERDTLRLCLEFMRSHKDCGGLTVKMLDGKGRYLRESKRGFPSPATSFYKIIGLSSLFPHSKRLAAYYMGHLDENQTHEVDILPGAFLMVSRAAYQKVGGLDESFFMYGEDIDYSWRIKLAGFANYYLPAARIIHYKGESTKKSSLNYVYTFYNAMAIFSSKYFSGGGAKFYNTLIHLAIWLRASVSFLGNILRRLAVPVADFLLAYGGFLAIKQLWAQSNYTVTYYPATYTWLVLPLYVLVLMLGGWLAGGYEKPVRMSRMARGMGMGAVALLVFYSLIGEEMRYSRAILLLGAAWSIGIVTLLRLAYSGLRLPGFALRAKQSKMLVIGSAQEAHRVKRMLTDMGTAANKVETIATDETNGNRMPSHEYLRDYARYHGINELIFCSKDIPIQHIITTMDTLKSLGIEYKIVPSDSDYVVGGDMVGSESLLTIDLQTIASPLNQRNKRLFDATAAVMLMVLSPIIFWFQERKHTFFKDIFNVLIGKRSWVGFACLGRTSSDLPKVRDGIFSPADLSRTTRKLNPQRLNLRYAKNYSVRTDLSILLRNMTRI